MGIKIGDWALLVHIKSAPNLNGRVVEVVRIATGCEKFVSTAGRMCRVVLDDRVAWTVRCREPIPWERFEEGFYELPFLEGNLFPITGVPSR
ncbi:hypothetical protein [Burkholderia sp. JP2-270]|uniref:hypothetical protein n=1 Tax=Burkholderia sp. JP2-270 TaxID=2217913 RepID=UPI0013A6C031|nr:hypothetical protein [Burkholderia sp. JP2-270]